MTIEHRTRRDQGMTLIELLVSVIVIGSIAAVLAAALTVTFRQRADTEARLDVARWGQSLALWLPSDLASASDVSAAESDAPCGSPDCTFGTNALQLKWDDGTGETTVSYRYGPAGDGESFILTRVECKAGSCSSRVVLRDLSPPLDDDGNPVAWSAGDPVPDEVIDVTVPLDVMSSDPDGTTDTSTRAQRVIVNVNGAPGVDGADRSSRVSFTAGGSSLGTLEPATFSGPTFLQANSGCGGPITLIIDESGSIGDTNMGKVKTAVRSFVNAFEGTPTRLQIITFDTKSATLGSVSGSWNRFFDLAEPSDVDILMGPTGTSGLVSNLDSDGGTNWEDALHRAFYSKDGQTYDQFGNPSAPTPELVVFFTDGVPTFDRIGGGSYTGTTVKSDTSSVGPPSIPPRFNYLTASSSGSGTSGSSYG
ncbi:MAG: VWA domain-containing protein, partial [Ilumatobacteraceae bacterium]